MFDLDLMEALLAQCLKHFLMTFHVYAIKHYHIFTQAPKERKKSETFVLSLPCSCQLPPSFRHCPLRMNKVFKSQKDPRVQQTLKNHYLKPQRRKLQS